MTNKEILKKLKELYSDIDNNIIEIGTFDGGNDSGGCEIDIIDSELNNSVSNLIYDELDYGSWGGNFYAGGNIFFNKQKEYITIEGTEEDEENLIHLNTLNFNVSLLKNEYFDSLNIHINEYTEDNLSINCRINIKSGFKTSSIINFEKTVISKIEEVLDECQTEYRRMYIDENYSFDELKKLNWNIPIKIQKLNIIDINEIIYLNEEN